MKTAVFIKQVPDTNDVKWTKDNNIDRTNTESILNPLDVQAIAAAAKLKKKYGGEITAVSMGVLKAQSVLKEASALGADNLILLSDSKFAGSDTCACSKVLASAAAKFFPDADLLIFGQSASDGETGQTGIETAARLNLPFVSQVNDILDLSDGILTVSSETETQKSILKIKLPAAICINNFADKIELPKISGYIKAHDADVKIFGINDLDIKPEETGIKGSPTYVSKVYKTHEERDCRFVDIQELISIIKEAVK